MGNCGLQVRDERLRPLEPVVVEWIKCINDYVDVWGGGDLPYWYNERANVGVLSGAAWRANFTALEEYQVMKGAADEGPSDSNSNSTWRGRNDLYIANRDYGVCIEAKVIFPEITGVEELNDLITAVVKRALRDAEAVDLEDLKASAVFVCPHSKGKPATETEIERFLQEVGRQHHGLVAWCQPSASQMTASHDGKFYPLAILLMSTVGEKTSSAR